MLAPARLTPCSPQICGSSGPAFSSTRNRNSSTSSPLSYRTSPRNATLSLSRRGSQRCSTESRSAPSGAARCLAACLSRSLHIRAPDSSIYCQSVSALSCSEGERTEPGEALEAIAALPPSLLPPRASTQGNDMDIDEIFKVSTLLQTGRPPPPTLSRSLQRLANCILTPAASSPPQGLDQAQVRSPRS